MRFLGSLLVSHLLAFERGFKDHEICLETHDITKNVENGAVLCNKSTCNLKCDPHFHTYGGPSRVKCKTFRKQRNTEWNKPIGTCKTCVDLNIDESIFKQKCTTLKTGLKRCIITCRNGKGILPINKQRAISICKCIWNKDKDDRCHWRLGTRIIDKAEFDIHVDNWTCGLPTTVAPVSTAVSVSVDYRIPPNLVCRNSGDRIVGGLEAIPHSWPWIAHMYFGGFICGGTVIDDETILSAAHCCKGFEKKPHLIRAFVGIHDKNKIEDGEMEFRAKKIFVHPEFQRRTLLNDICVVKVPNMKLSIRKNVAPACLPAAGDHPDHDTRCWAAGWGRMSNRRVADVLQEVDLKIISDEVCMNTANKGHLYADKMFCAGYLKGGKDGCQGDSGGPLICEKDGQPILVGVTSWGFGCGKVNSPGVWTKVASYTDWIKNLMKP